MEKPWIKFWLGIGILLLICSLEVSTENCCEKLDIKKNCHFLCGTKTSWQSLLNWKCYRDYGASVLKCATSSAFDYVKLFGHRFTQTVQKGFEKLSNTVKQKLSDVQSFATATIAELKTVPQDVLAKLSTVKGMTSNQLKGLATRLQDFTTQNLREFTKLVKLDVLYENLKELGKEKNWDLQQAQVFVEAAYRKYGPEIKSWTGEQIKSLGNFLKALPYEDLAKISASAFDTSMEAICKASLTLDQKASVLVSAESAFGTISKWKSNQLIRMCDTIVAITPDDIMKFSVKTFQDSTDFLRKQVWDKPQTKALFRKSKELFGEVKSWSGDQLKKLGKMVQGIEPHEIVELPAAAVKDALEELGQIEWDASQLDKIANKLKEGLGSLNTWMQNDLKKAKGILAGLTVSELEQLRGSEIVAALKELKDVKWTPEQALVIFKKVKDVVPVPSLTKDQVLALGNVLDQVASSEVGKFGHGILIAVFPQLTHIQGIATPVLRKFIEEYKKSGDTKDIGLLGGIAEAMTRVDLSKSDIADMLGSMEKLTGIDWNEEQIAELIIKAKAQLGELSKTDDTDTDSPPWGAKNLEKLGKVVLGLTKEELKNYPIRGIEDGIEALGKQMGWKRGQVLTVTKRLREYLEAENKTIFDLKEAELQSIGTFLQGLTLAELEKLPDKVTLMVVRKLGEQTGLPEDKLRSRAFWALNVLKAKSNGVLKSKEVKALGNLVAGLGGKAMDAISSGAFVDYVDKMVRSPGFRKDKFREIVSRAKSNFGESDAGKWIGSYWEKLGPAVTAMDSSEIYRINKLAFLDAVEELGKVRGYTRKQAEALIYKAKEHWNIKDVSMWSAQQLRSLGTLIKGLNVDEIKKLAKDALTEIVGDCKRFEDLEDDKLKAFADRAKQLLASGSLSSLSPAEARKMWCLMAGFSAKELQKLRLDIDLIDRLGNLSRWSEDQLKVLKVKVKSHFKSNPDPFFLMSIGNILKAYTPQEIKDFSDEAFTYAAGKLGRIEGLNKEQVKALAEKAKSAWGEVSTWTKAQIAEGGNFIVGLKTLDLSEIKPENIDAIKPEVIKEMNLEQIQAFSEAQFMAMEKSQTQMISKEYRSKLRAPKAAALKSVEDNDPEDEDPWRCPGPNCSTGMQIQVSSSTLIVSFLFMFITLRGFW